MTVLLIFLPGLIAAVLYWPTLQLPLMYDDLLHIRITKGLDLLSVWRPTQSFGFYRPLTFFPLLVIKGVFGHYPPVLLHGLNVAQHTLNAVLISWLSWRLWQRRHRAVAGGLFLALFPFSYQAVAVYGHNVHPATTGLILLALHTYLSARKAHHQTAAWWGLTVLLFVLGLLSHESAVLFGAFAALVQWNAEGWLPSLPIDRPVRFKQALAGQPWIFFLLAGFAYFIGYQFVPLSRAPQASFEGSALWYKFLYLIQAAGYPFSWFGQFLPKDAVVAALVAIGGVALTLLLTVWCAQRLANRLPLLLGWGWWGLASVLIAIPLPAGYLLHGPRLLYLGSAGLALLWPVLLEPVYERSKAGRPGWAAMVVFILAGNWLFVADRLDAYDRLTGAVDVVEQVMDDRPPGEGVLLVNLPGWTAPPKNTYPVGVELVAMMGSYLFVEELVGENLAVDRPAQAIEVPDLLAGRDYTYGIHEQAAGTSIADWAPDGSHVFITTYEEKGPVTRYAGRLSPEPVERSPLASIGPYTLMAAETHLCGTEIQLTTTWLVSEAADGGIIPTTSVFAQWLDSDGRLIAQADSPLLGMRPDLLQAPPDWTVVDFRQLAPPNEEASEQPGRVLLGVYDYTTGERYPATGGEGTPLTDNAYSITPAGCP